jgi:hypothetical protein
MLLRFQKRRNLLIKSVIWKSAEKERCIQMHMNGATAREIGIAISRSRNSVIGFLNRAGYARPRVVKPKVEALPKPKERVKSATVIRINPITKGAFVPKPEPILVHYTVPLIERDMTYECAWIIGEVNGGNSRCCGQVIYRKSLCKAHHDVAYERRVIFSSKPKREFTFSGRLG